MSRCDQSPHASTTFTVWASCMRACYTFTRRSHWGAGVDHKRAYIHTYCTCSHALVSIHTEQIIVRVSWLYSPVSEAWQRLNLPSCFGWAMNAKRLDSFGWGSRWGRYFGWIVIQWNICLDVCWYIVCLRTCCFFQPHQSTVPWYWTILQNLRLCSIPAIFKSSISATSIHSTFCTM